MNSYSSGFGKAQLSSSALMVLFVVIGLGVTLVEKGRAGCDEVIESQTPLNDLGTDSYTVDEVDYEGGLYAAGKNQRPAGYNTAGINAAALIEPLGTFGNPNPNGKIGVVSIGMCNAWMEFGQPLNPDPFALIPQANPLAYNSVNPKLIFANGAQPGADAPKWTTANSPTWMNVLDPKWKAPTGRP